MNYKIYDIGMDVDINMTSRAGQILTTYDELVEVFGEPTITTVEGLDKTTKEWYIEFVDVVGRSVVATIYDWKYGSTPWGEVMWNIGGRDSRAADAVTERIEEYREYQSNYV
jgi:hypothetical protein|tara:strand:- start:8074 stop:8409 length:336 start_codon:yes stop_codon:yes gene_type:complete